MMRKENSEQNSKENHIIDSYYDEASKSMGAHEEADEEFKAKMEASLKKMNIIEDFDFNLDINTLEIISKAENIVTKKKMRNESFMFILVCIVIISAFAFLAINVDVRVVIAIEVIISAVLPLTIIPIASMTKAKGGA
jgi:hypothetical protein